MKPRSAHQDYQLHRIEATLQEIGGWPDRKRRTMRALICALEQERDALLRSHAQRGPGTSRRLAGLAAELSA